VCRLAEESGRHADLVLILAFTGLRWGAAIALTVADVEFLKRRIAVHRNAVQVGQDFEVGQTKGKEDRTVPVAASVLSRLAARCEGRSASDLLFPARGGGYLKRPSYDSTGGSIGRSSAPRCRRSRLTICGTHAHRWRSVPVRMFSRCRGCWATKTPASRCGSTATCSTPTLMPWPSIWTRRSQIVSKAPADRRRQRTKTAI
jgi:integrase